MRYCLPFKGKLENDKYDEAVDVSMSMDQGNSPAKGKVYANS